MEEKSIYGVKETNFETASIVDISEKIMAKILTI